MGIIVIWDDEEQTIVRFVYAGLWTWEEFNHVIREGNAMMDTVNHPVVSIVDMSNSSHVPPNALVHIKWAVDYSGNHNNSRIVVFAGATAFYKTMLNVLTTLYPHINHAANFLHVNTLDEARQLARQYWQALTEKEDKSGLP